MKIGMNNISVEDIQKAFLLMVEFTAKHYRHTEFIASIFGRLMNEELEKI
jgi:hypothetical protein